MIEKTNLQATWQALAADLSAVQESFENKLAESKEKAAKAEQESKGLLDKLNFLETDLDREKSRSKDLDERVLQLTETLRDLNAAYERKQAQSANESRAWQNEIQKLEEEIDSLHAQQKNKIDRFQKFEKRFEENQIAMATLAKENNDLKGIISLSTEERANLKKELVAATEKVQAIYAQLEHQQKENAQSRAKIESLTKEAQEQARVLTQTKKEATTSTHQLERQLRENQSHRALIEKLNREIQELSAKNKNSERAIEELTRSNKKIHQERDGLEARISSISKELETYRQQVFTLSEVEVNASGRIKELEVLLNQREQEAAAQRRELDRELASTRASLEEATSQVAHLMDQLEVLRRHGLDQVGRINDLESELAAKTRTASELEDRVDELERLRADLANNLVKAEHFIESEQERTRFLMAELETRENELRESIRKVESLETNRGTLEDTLQKTDIAQRSLQQEIHLLKQLLNAKNSRQEALESELNSRKVELDRRERQLDHYVETLNRSKYEVRDQAAKLENEIHLVKSFNPIADYLKLTEREIARVETQLKRTPTLSTERPHLEQCLEELMAQREFLRTSLSRNETDLAIKTARLTDIAKSDALVPSPPKPPLVKP